MARGSASSQSKQIQDLKKENQRLLAENKQLKQKTSTVARQGWFSRTWRNITVFILVALAGAILVAANLLFWAGHTVVDSQSYKNTIAPLVKDPDVQSAVALYTTNQIFENNDVTSQIQSVLPPRAAFLAPQLTSQLRSVTQTALQKTLASDKFQTLWVNVNVKAHDSLLALANSPSGQDGVIDVNELYQQLSNNVENTKLSFLANKKLPSKVGDITVLKSNKLHTLHVISTNINTLKYLSLALVVAFTALAAWLSKNRRRLVISAALLYTILMLLTLISIRLLVSIVASKAQPEYQAGVSSAANIILHPLVIQTRVVFLIGAVITLGAWLSGPYKSAIAVRSRLQMLLDGKVHQAIFPSENSFTLWFGKHKKVLQWLSVLVVALVALFIHLTPLTVIVMALVALLLTLVVETLAAQIPLKT